MARRRSGLLVQKRSLSYFRSEYGALELPVWNIEAARSEPHQLAEYLDLLTSDDERAKTLYLKDWTNRKTAPSLVEDLQIPRALQDDWF